MNRLILLMLMVFAALGMSAQQRLATDAFFDGRYDDDPRVEVTSIKGNPRPGISMYRSLAFNSAPAEASAIEAAVKRDGARALSREMKYKDGRLQYAFLVMPPAGRLNRYVFYVAGRKERKPSLLLIYMEGKAEPSQIQKLLKKPTK